MSSVTPATPDGPGASGPAASPAPGTTAAGVPAGTDASEQPLDAVRPTDHPASGMTQDLRFAVAMSGGVSLAVWMGGVAREMNLLQQASNCRVDQDSPAPSPPLPVTVSAEPSHDGQPGARARDWDARSRGLYLGLLRLLDVRVTGPPPTPRPAVSVAADADLHPEETSQDTGVH